jgi:hypothetical protein
MTRTEIVLLFIAILILSIQSVKVIRNTREDLKIHREVLCSASHKEQ